MAVPDNIEELAHKVRNAIYGRDVRESLASSMEATADIADWSREVAQQIVDGSFDEGKLNTAIESKLNQLEQDYTPKLTSIENEVENARGNESSLGDNLNSVHLQLAETATKEELSITDSVAAEALAKADNPLNAISSSGYKLKLSDLSEEVTSAMSGTTPITDSKGLLNNSGVEFPLKKVVRNGFFEDIDAELKNAILDFKVINAKKGKYYRIQWMGNGVSSLGEESTWGFIITGHNKDTFASESETNYIRHVNRNDYNFNEPAGITTRYLESSVDDVSFVVTVDYSKLLNRTSYDLNNNLGSKVGYSSVIDEGCYIFAPTHIEQKPLICARKGTNLRVKFKYTDTVDLVLDFDLLGVNEILHLKKVSRQVNAERFPLPFWGNAVEWYSIDTDWVSPYGILASSNVVNPDSTFSVGGNHGTEGAEGFPTARNLSFELYADNRLVNDNETAYSDKVVIKVVNFVSASNAIDLISGEKRDSVKEYVTYTITNNSVEVSVSLEAMEDVNITRYAGLQATKGSYNEVYFMLDSGSVVHDITTTPPSQINSGDRTNSSVDRILLKSGIDLLAIYMDRSIGIGDLSYFATGATMAYYSTANKAYLHNVSGRTLTLPAGDSVYYRGGYTFMVSLECLGAESAYILKNNNKNHYTVDFLGEASNTILKPLPEDYGKTITVLEKSDTITVDNFISSKGLKISSTGYGQLKFTVD